MVDHNIWLLHVNKKQLRDHNKTTEKESGPHEYHEKQNNCESHKERQENIP